MRTPPAGKDMVKGSMIPGLTVTIQTDRFTFAVASDGHEWAADALDKPDDAPNALWTHFPSVCPLCSDLLARMDFARPHGVIEAETRR